MYEVLWHLVCDGAKMGTKEVKVLKRPSQKLAPAPRITNSKVLDPQAVHWLSPEPSRPAHKGIWKFSFQRHPQRQLRNSYISWGEKGSVCRYYIFLTINFFKINFPPFQWFALLFLKCIVLIFVCRNYWWILNRIFLCGPSISTNYALK